MPCQAVRRLAAEYETFRTDTPGRPATKRHFGETHVKRTRGRPRTMDNRPTSAIANIGAVWFGRAARGSDAPVQHARRPRRLPAAGLTIGADTVRLVARPVRTIASLRNGQDCAAPLVPRSGAPEPSRTSTILKQAKSGATAPASTFPIWPTPSRRRRKRRGNSGKSATCALLRACGRTCASAQRHHHALDDALHAWCSTSSWPQMRAVALTYHIHRRRHPVLGHPTTCANGATAAKPASVTWHNGPSLPGKDLAFSTASASRMRRPVHRAKA